SDQASERDIVVPDAQLAAFPEQALGKLYLRTLPQIVSRGLETQAEQRDFFLTGFEHHLNCAVEVFVVAGDERLEQWQFKVEFLGPVVERADILGQARTS